MKQKTDSTPESGEQLALYTERAAGERVVHGLLRGTEAYDAWHLALYFKEMLQYKSLAANMAQLRLEDIPRKEKILFLYEIFRFLNFRLKYLELGSSLFEVIDGLEFVACLLGERVDLSNVLFVGLESSDVFRRGAERLHPNHRLQQFSDPAMIVSHDVLYDRAVSSYCFRPRRNWLT